ncbi:hypothetical protein [Rosenbergiella australiborealis]|uniref:hypothetical protein n=1 Tax=Rosenbergiella australiborealis TaxID=1544696 RepID=UPI001F4EB014|nr:hypothetical protein [Rosenbergiella australiborealis]
MRHKSIFFLLSTLTLSSYAALADQNDNRLNDYNQLCNNPKGSLKVGDIAVVQDTQPYWVSDSGLIYSESEYARKKVNQLQSIASVITGSKENDYKYIQITLLKDIASSRSSCVPAIIGSSLYSTILSKAPVGQKVLIQKTSESVSGYDFYKNATHSGFVFAPILR